MTRQDIAYAVGNISTRHIQEAESFFEEGQIARIRIRKIALLAAIITCFITLSAFAVSKFSTWSGDRLVMSAQYSGSGIVWLEITNQSDKDLKLEPAVKLYYYSTQKPVASKGEEPIVSNLTVSANATQKVRVDLRRAYDVEALENTSNEMYYLQVTNDGFILGQKWNCMISFKVGDYVTPYYEVMDDSNLHSVLPSRQAYFYNYTPDIFARWPDAFEYMDLVEAELVKVEGNIIDPVYPGLLLEHSNVEMIPHPGIPDNYQNYTAGATMLTSFDGYNKLMARDDSIDIATITMVLPRVLDNGDFNAGVSVPIFYLFSYETYQTKNSSNYTFVRGNLLSFAEMEPYKVYEDDQYVCYNMTPLFYTDLRTYIEEMLIQRDDIYFDDIIWQRIESFYNYYQDLEVMGSHMYYREGMNKYNESPLTLDYLIGKGNTITISDLAPYDPKTIEGEKIGFRYHIDESYHVEGFIDMIIVDGELQSTEETIWLIYDATGDRCNLRTEDAEVFVKAHDG